jgi:hypothetical protein
MIKRKPRGRLQRLLLSVIAGSFILGGPEPSLASTPQLQERLQATVNAIWEADVAEPALRSHLANAAEAYWISFDSRIPELTQKENEYLNRALFPNGGTTYADMDKIIARMNSAQFSLREVKEFSSRCRKRHEELTLVIGSGAEERLAWLRVASCYSDTQIASDLEKIRLLNGRPDGAFQMKIMGWVLQLISGKIADALAQ